MATLNQRAGLARVFLAMLSAVSLLGCQTMWDRLRERERGYAQTHGRELVRAGDCADALRSLERSQAHPDLGGYASESTYLKARCLERLGRTEEALAHLRMLVDFYPDSRFVARIDPGRREDFAATRFSTPPGGGPEVLRIPAVRYEPYAKRSGITGLVHIEYLINRDGETERIRVVRSEHPVLASWAIETMARADVRRADLAGLDLPRPGTSVFNFQTYWSLDEEEAAAEVEDGVAPEVGGEASGSASDDDDGWQWEWLIP